MSCESPTSELPGEAAAGKEFAQGGTTPPLRRSLRTSRNLRFSVIKVRVPLQQSSLREGARDHCFRYEARNEGMEVCVGGKCRPEDRQCHATGISRLQRWWYASILPPYAASAAGSFQAVTPLPPQAPSEESRPSTPRKSADGKIIPRSYLVYILNFGGKAEMTFAHRDGCYATPTERLGSAIIY